MQKSQYELAATKIFGHYSITKTMCQYKIKMEY